MKKEDRVVADENKTFVIFNTTEIGYCLFDTVILNVKRRFNSFDFY